MCYFKKEQHGWTPLENVDPTESGTGNKPRPSFKLWYEYKEVTGHNPEGVEKFKDSPRLYNYNRRNKQSSTPFKTDTTRGALEGRVCSPRKEKQILEDKITNIDGAVGREGWRAHVTMGNGVVRWTDDVFDWQNMKMVSSDNLNENGKSTFLFPNELAPMYSSFTSDKVYRWKPPMKVKKKKKVKKLTKEQLVEIAEIRRKNMEKGSVHGTRPSPRKMSVTKTGFHGELLQSNQVLDQVLDQQSPIQPPTFIRTAPPETLSKLGSSITESKNNSTATTLKDAEVEGNKTTSVRTVPPGRGVPLEVTQAQDFDVMSASDISLHSARPVIGKKEDEIRGGEEVRSVTRSLKGGGSVSFRIDEKK